LRGVARETNADKAFKDAFEWIRDNDKGASGLERGT